MKTLLATTLITALAASAQAQSLTGGAVGLGLLRYSEDGVTGVASSASAELGLGPQFALQGDYSALTLRGDGDSEGSSALALHAIYHAGGAGSVGAYLGRDFASDERDALDFWGVEATTRFGALEAELFYTDILDESLTHYGLSADYALTPAIRLTGTAQRLDGADDSVNRLGLGAGYDLGAFEISGEAGRLSDDVTYIGLGANWRFGGTAPTFGTRNLTDILGGY